MKHILLAWAGFLVGFVVVRHLWPSGILYYQGVAVAGVVAAAHLLICLRRGAAPKGAALKDALLVFLGAYAFMFTVPTTVDRAYSVRMIEHLRQLPEGASRAQLAEHFSGDFVRHGGVERRIFEQKRTGTVVEDGGRIRLTPLGRALAGSFEATCLVFACQAPGP